jgi:WD40 repeat protein
MKVLRGHKGDVYSVVICGGYIASTGYDKSIKIWNADTGRHIRNLLGHTSIVKSLCAVSDENSSFLVSGSWDNTVRLWNLVNGECLQVLNGHTNRVKAVSCFVNVEIYIFSGGDDCLVKLWSTTHACEIKTWAGHSQPVTCVAVSNGIRIRHGASGSADGTVRIWELPPPHTFSKRMGQSIIILNGHSQAVSSVAFSSFELAMQIYTGGEDGFVIVWEYETGQPLRRFDSRGVGISGMVCMLRGNVESIVSTLFDGTIRVWDCKTGNESKRENIREGKALSCVACQEDMRGTLVVVGGSDGFLRLLPRMEDIYYAQDIAGKGLKIKFTEGVSTGGMSRVQFQIAKKSDRPATGSLAIERNNLPKITRNVRYYGREPLKSKPPKGGRDPATIHKDDVDSSLDLQITKSAANSPTGSPRRDGKGRKRLDTLSNSPDVISENPSTGSEAVNEGETVILAATLGEGDDLMDALHYVDRPLGAVAAVHVRGKGGAVDESQREAPRVFQRKVKPHTAATMRRNRHLPKIYPVKKEFVLTVSQYVEPLLASGSGNMLTIQSYSSTDSL